MHRRRSPLEAISLLPNSGSQTHWVKPQSHCCPQFCDPGKMPLGMLQLCKQILCPCLSLSMQLVSQSEKTASYRLAWALDRSTLELQASNRPGDYPNLSVVPSSTSFNHHSVQSHRRVRLAWPIHNRSAAYGRFHFLKCNHFDS
jgi:hypothetical protein